MLFGFVRFVQLRGLEQAAGEGSVSLSKFVTVIGQSPFGKDKLTYAELCACKANSSNPNSLGVK